MPKTFYITTPLYYVNAKPHIGHAYTEILCDTFARFQKFTGRDVFFMTGTDEHGTKIEKTARDQGKEPREYVDAMIPHFKDLWQKLGIEYDYFIRTTEDRHKKTVQKILLDLEAKGEIYAADYEGWYSIKSETFYTESELVDGRCPDTGGEVQKIVEKNYFFKMSKYQDWLIEYIEKHPDFIRPSYRRNEILGFLRQPLSDLCITRPRERLKWGIDYPSSKDHVVYVWFDALVNYISGAGYGTDEARFKSLWPADVHVIGKDIIRHHAVYWPVMLKAIGVAMPESILAHGWWTLGGSKVSKSSGNSVDPVELMNKYTVDGFRYFLLNEVTVGQDGAYSEDLIRERYRTDLANDLGNLFFRAASMIARYYEGALPDAAAAAQKNPLAQQAFGLYDQACAAMKDYNPRGALEPVFALIVRANQFVEERQPWKLAKDPAKKDELAETMFVLADCLAHAAAILQAFLPATAHKILTQLNLPSPMKIKNSAEFTKFFVKSGAKIDKGEPLFPKLEDEEEKV